MIGVLGSGSWATCIVKILLEKEGRSVNWFVRDQEIADGVCRCGKNPRYLCHTYLDPSRLHISTDIRKVVEESDELYLVVPSAFVEEQLADIPKPLIASKVWVSAVKGIVAQTDYVVSDYLHTVMGVSMDNIAVAAGPTHAEELSCAQNSVISVASCNMDLAKRVSEQLRCSYLYTYCTDAMRSVEYAGVLKNVYAVACGLLFGLGYGANMVSTVVSCAMEEMTNFVDNVLIYKPQISDSKLLVADLMVTCWSEHSRNRRLGTLIGEGYSVEEAKRELTMVAEGYYSANSIYKIAQKYQIRVPIAESVYNVLYNRADPHEEFQNLLDQLWNKGE